MAFTMGCAATTILSGLRNVGAKSEAIIGVGGGNRPSYSECFRETPCADPYAGCCGGWGLDTPGYPITTVIIGISAAPGN